MNIFSFLKVKFVMGKIHLFIYILNNYPSYIYTFKIRKNIFGIYIYNLNLYGEMTLVLRGPWLVILIFGEKFERKCEKKKIEKIKVKRNKK